MTARGEKITDWDYKFHNQSNNFFRKQWSKPDLEDHRILTVTEANGGYPCAACRKPVGEVAGSFYEIDRQRFCLKCGKKVVNVNESGAREFKSDPTASAIP